jgi:hypothetical protein
MSKKNKNSTGDDIIAASLSQGITKRIFKKALKEGNLAKDKNGEWLNYLTEEQTTKVIYKYLIKLHNGRKK